MTATAPDVDYNALEPGERIPDGMLFVGIFTEAANGKQRALLRTELRVIRDWDLQAEIAKHPGCRLPTVGELDVIRHYLTEGEKYDVNMPFNAFARAAEEKGLNGKCLLTGHEGFSHSSTFQTCFVRSVDLT